MKSFFYLLILFLAGTKKFKSCASQSVVETLPGYAGPLPFKLETGYIGVGENEEVQMFYYFVQSEKDPRRDPLFFWLTGGPGCSGLTGLVYEIGPLAFDLENFDGSLPSLLLNPYSWTKVANIIFVDSPVGTGFSYSNASKDYASSDTKATQDVYTFLRKWLLSHPEFIKNRLFIAGDSYGGKIVPMLALLIAKGNEAGLVPRMYLEGYIVGNPVTDEDGAANERIPFAHRMALISDQQFKLARSSCHGDYVNVDPNNIQCSYALHVIQECTNLINIAHVLEPQCKDGISPKSSDSRSFQPSLLDVDDDPRNLLSLNKLKKCRSWGLLLPIGVTSSIAFVNGRHVANPRGLDFPKVMKEIYVLAYIWANDESVRESLHIREGTVTYWRRCNERLSYEHDVVSAAEYHQLLSDKGFQGLIYSGDHDMQISYMSTLKWIRKLNISLDEEWRPWSVDGQVAGYTELYKNNLAYITFATVKGAGHIAPEYKPKECFEMVKRWISLYPL